MSTSFRGRISRRDALRLSLLTLGAGLVPAGCSKAPAPPGASSGPDAPAGHGAFFAARELALLAEVVEVVIPATDTPGARAADVHGFIDRMMAEWALPKTQGIFRNLLNEIDASAQWGFGAGFMHLSPQQRFEVLRQMDAAAFNESAATRKFMQPNDLQPESRPVHPFVRLKELVFLGYYQSEIGATQELQFQPVPGSYRSCVPLSSIGRAAAGNTKSLGEVRSRLINQCGC